MATAAGDAKAMVEVDLTKALNSLAPAEEGGHRSEAGFTRIEVDFARIEAEQRAERMATMSRGCQLDNNRIWTF